MTVAIHADQNNFVKFRQLWPGIKDSLNRLPRLIGLIRHMRKIKDKERLDSIGLYVEKNAAIYPDNIALKYEDLQYTHKEFNERINQYADYFLSLGLKKGDTIVVDLENRPEFFFVVCGAGKIGVVPSLINTKLRARVLVHVMKTIPGKLYIIGEEVYDRFDEIRSELYIGENEKICFVPDTGEKPVPEGCVNLTERVKQCSMLNPATTREIRVTDPFAYIFTSGTTGMPKAAILPHQRLVMSMIGCGKILLNMTPEDTLYCTLPLFHGTALGIAWPAALSNGSALAVRRKFSVSHFWKDAEKFNATGFVYIGELCRYLMNQPESPDDIRNPMKTIIGNGLRADIWMAFKNRFGIEKVYEIYGASEFPFLFFNFFNIDCSVGICSSPRAIVKYDIEADKPVLNKKGFMQKVKKGEVGLLLGEISADTLFTGYTNKKETEKKVFRDVFKKGDAWVNTGDLMREIGHQHVQFVDRLGDTYRWQGENVSTTEVEEVISMVTNVSVVTAYGVKIPNTEGRAGMAAIIPTCQPEEFNLDELGNTLMSNLPAYAVPKFIRFKAELEITPTFKIKKTGLKEEGFDLEKVSDPLVVLLPGENNYKPLTRDIYQGICDGQFRF